MVVYGCTSTSRRSTNISRGSELGNNVLFQDLVLVCIPARRTTDSVAHMAVSASALCATYMCTILVI